MLLLASCGFRLDEVLDDLLERFACLQHDNDERSLQAFLVFNQEVLE